MIKTSTRRTRKKLRRRFCGVKNTLGMDNKHERNQEMKDKLINILFISQLSGDRSGGPTYSVPAQVRAQMAFDHVYWLNLSNANLPEWNEGGLVCHCVDAVPNQKLSDLPAPFDAPDLVVFEEFYRFKPTGLTLEIFKKRIPYVIIPRSSMTREAQNHKRLKKNIGNAVWFTRFANHAAGIQFLTPEEKQNSMPFGKKNGYVVPNGIDIPRGQTTVSPDRMQCTYIGRIRTYQKGLERMIEAVAKCASLIRKVGARFDLYGSDLLGARALLEEKIVESGIEDLMEIHDAIYGEEKKKVLLQADVFVMTSLFEGMSMGMIEALAYGLPCIATEGTNMAAAIEEAGAGWNAGNSVEEIANAIEKMIAEKANLCDYGNRARELAKKYSWNTIAQQSHEQYRRII